MEEPISVRTFGTFELAFGGHPVERWKAGKARSLLQFLLLRHGRIVSRDVLHESLWPDASWSKGSSSLKVAAHMLRKILAGQPVGGPALRLLTRESGYLLEAVDVPLDFEVFIRLADEAHAAQLRGDRAEAAALYLRTEGLYAGDFLPDEPYEWAAAQREWLRSRLLCGLTYLAETNILHGDHVGVIRWCQRMLEVEPFHEEAFRALMLVHGHLGQLEQVQRWYRLCAGRLHDRLQMAPDPATRRLYTRAAHGTFTGRAIDPQVWRRELQPEGRPSLLRPTA
ncbi:BTAD domain-containing putative transcriptional regulator [Planomonospora sp. ID82291]|uniref:AfsR/SARP family transcriptional regulator n=1 Tax=Planomonospora sp. ID82291 TaxID=2738136 RepID=UPI0018C3B3EA|nr:BTAD domain-containing putative transcriptional regulator [Planomonospora sp. ID82291]MBG0816365.1 winged helix-turn-helix domain-containing protein [Planomonospora sp. ID82291]